MPGLLSLASPLALLGWASVGHCDMRHADGIPVVSEKYYCQDGYSNWATGWSDRKKKWCCQHAGLGCPSSEYPDTHPGKVPPAYEEVHSDARPTYKPRPTTYKPRPTTYKPRPTTYKPAYEEVHSDARHRYSEPFDCDAGLDYWRDGWSKSKIEWCCYNKQKGCASKPVYHEPVSKPVYREPVSKPVYREPVSKPVYREPVTVYPDDRPTPVYHERLTAQSDAEPDHHYVNHHKHEPYNCYEGYESWKTGWAVAKMAWCCHYHQRGCAATADRHKPPEPVHLQKTIYPPKPIGGSAYDCNAGLANFRAGWSNAKRAWCCDNHEVGCRVHYMYDKYDAEVKTEMEADGQEEPRKGVVSLLPRLGTVQVVVLFVAGCLGVAGIGFAVRSWGRRTTAAALLLDADGPVTQVPALEESSGLLPA